MLLFPVIYTLFCCIYLASAGNFSSRRSKRGVSEKWGYTEQNGPSTWGGTCQTGRRQSPINIELGSVIVKDFPSFNFGEHYLTKHKFNAINNGHTIYVTLEDNSIKPVIYGGGLGVDKFVFEQLHLHWESEHEFDGRRADLEMHIVHYNAKYGSFAEASVQPDGICVLAVIFNRSNQTDSLYQSFFEYILQPSVLGGHSSHAVPENSIPGNENGEEKLGFFTLREFLPRRVSRFFTYKGSLTTPGCTENVLWTVFINRISVASEVLTSLMKIKDHDGNVLSQNFRPPQNLNGREVYIQIRNDAVTVNAHNGSNMNTVFPIMAYIILVYWYFLL